MVAISFFNFLLWWLLVDVSTRFEERGWQKKIKQGVLPPPSREEILGEKKREARREKNTTIFTLFRGFQKRAGSSSTGSGPKNSCFQIC